MRTNLACSWTSERRDKWRKRTGRELVRKGGLEPPRFYPPDPKSGASANSATFAQPDLIQIGRRDKWRKRTGRELVRKGGLEPPRFYPPDPKSGASANSATFAQPDLI